MNEFSLNIYSNKAEELRQETEATFEQLNLATDVLPATMQPDDGAIKLVLWDSTVPVSPVLSR